MRIIQISDIHIRNFKYHKEYEKTFQELYRQMRDLDPDLVVNTGDTAHAKTQITPELVDMLSRHIIEVASIAPYRMILGNHDLNLKNLDRRDAISPIVSSLSRSGVDVELWTTVGPHRVDNATFWVYPIHDESNFPTKFMIESSRWKNSANIGLFHGSISGCKTDADWTMDDLEHDISLFEGLDYVMMGDIHKHQTWKDGRIAYAGSLIQQNFGETPDKGFLVWDIDDDDPSVFTMKHVKLKTPLSFYTVRASADLVVSKNLSIPDGAYVRVATDSSFTSAEQRSIVASAKEMYSATEVIVVNTNNSTKAVTLDTLGDEEVDFTDVKTQEKLLREYLAGRGLGDVEIERIVAIDRAVQTEIVADEDYAQGRHWNINKVAWSNFCQYGEDNIIDLSKVTGVYGIFGQNNAGKSTIFELITEGLYDRVTKDVPKNIDLINDDRDEAKIVLDVTVDDRDFIVERTISRVKKKDAKEWGKTSLDFYEVSKDGERTLLNGDTRPETERAIRRLIGGFDEFCLTSMSPQNTVFGIPGGGDIINCKDTDRRKLLYRFLGLDVFEKKLALAKETLKTLQAPSVSGDVDKEAARHEALVASLQKTRDQLEAAVEDDQVKTEKRLALQAELQLILSNEKVKEMMNTFDTDKGEEVFRYVESAESTLKRLRADLSSVITSRMRMWDERSALPMLEDSVDDPTVELRELAKAISANEVTYSKLEERLKSSKKKIKTLQQVPCGDQFPTCKFLIDAFEERAALPAIEGPLEELKKLGDDLNKQMVSLRDRERVWKKRCAAVAELDAIDRELSRMDSKVETLTEKVKNAEILLKNATRDHETFLSLKDDIRRATALKSNLDEIEKLYKACKSRVNSLRTTERAESSQEAVLRDRLTKLREEDEKRKTVERDRALLDIYCDAVGKNGVPRSVLVDALPNISREINQIVSSVSGMTVSLESDEEEQSLSLIVSSKNGRSRPVSLTGGAQKFIVSLAIRAALCKITSLPRSNMFIVDEGFGKLDPENSQAIQRMFQYLKSMFDHIIIVSHTEVMRDMVDGTIDIGVDDTGHAHVDHT